MRTKRPPIIVVVGHVDHGKTTLLDAIRKADIAAGEAGGITQSIGAYEIVHGGEKMTFIDTPGHAAFMGMRSRGAKIADLAIVVVAADDGVLEQTKEAIRIVTETETPFVVAITKSDRQPNPEKAKNGLMQEGVLLEGYGGSVSYQAVSGKTGEGVSELLDLTLLVAETLGLEYDPASPAKGVVIEAKKDPKKGIVAHAIVTDGTLSAGMDIGAESVGCRVRSLEDALGKRVESCTASCPVAIWGFKEMPSVGVEFMAGGKVVPKEVVRPERRRVVREQGITTMNVIIKAGSQGALEAVAAAIRAIVPREGSVVRVLYEGVGEITDGDVQWFVASESERGIAVGFGVDATKPAETMAKTNRIKVVKSAVIYDLTKAVEEALGVVGRAAATGDLEVLAIFGAKGTGRIVGGKVVTGEIRSGAGIYVEREGAVVGQGKIASLQTGKNAAETVGAGNECGMVIEAEFDIKVGDRVMIRE